LDFYIVTATVIPVLYLAAIYQARTLLEGGLIVSTVRGGRNADRSDMALVVAHAAFVAAAVLGEYAALHTLAIGKASSDARSTIATALIALGWLLVVENILRAMAGLGVPRGVGKGFVALATLAAIVFTLVRMV
jgi:hypothetical protein